MFGFWLERKKPNIFWLDVRIASQKPNIFWLDVHIADILSLP
jgi:hypothetical protein